MRLTAAQKEIILECTNRVPLLQVSQTPGQVRFKGEVVFTTASGRELVAFVSGLLCAWQNERAL